MGRARRRRREPDGQGDIRRPGEANEHRDRAHHGPFRLIPGRTHERVGQLHRERGHVRGEVAGDGRSHDTRDDSLADGVRVFALRQRDDPLRRQTGVLWTDGERVGAIRRDVAAGRDPERERLRAQRHRVAHRRLHGGGPPRRRRRVRGRVRDVVAEEGVRRVHARRRRRREDAPAAARQRGEPRGRRHDAKPRGHEAEHDIVHGNAGVVGVLRHAEIPNEEKLPRPGVPRPAARRQNLPLVHHHDALPRQRQRLRRGQRDQHILRAVHVEHAPRVRRRGVHPADSVGEVAVHARARGRSVQPADVRRRENLRRDAPPRLRDTLYRGRRLLRRRPRRVVLAVLADVLHHARERHRPRVPRRGGGAEHGSRERHPPNLRRHAPLFRGVFDHARGHAVVLEVVLVRRPHEVRVGGADDQSVGRERPGVVRRRGDAARDVRARRREQVGVRRVSIALLLRVFHPRVFSAQAHQPQQALIQYD
mmetsp:Transcript_827/g.2684  ORF Transcript_827/g.2684 Transcript_827/m.2684 type:complete len:479 (-) Transcript_827:2-1438(-)